MYAVYLRKSRADDPREPLEETLRRHREILEHYINEHGLPVSPEAVYEEVVSGDSLFARPQMLRLLEAVEAGRYEGVICVDIQRLGRGSMRDQGAILDAFKYSGTKILTPQRTYDLSDETDETYTEFETFLGRQELKMIKRRLRRGIQKTIEEGGYLANAPFGYQKARCGRHPTLEPLEAEAETVRQIFDLYASRGMGCQQIADTINQLGARPRRAPQFGRTSIALILHNPVYAGKIVWNRKTRIHSERSEGKRICNPPESWTVTKGLHPAIIEEEIFDRVQKMLLQKNHSQSGTRTLVNPLAGLAFCARCGTRMQRQENPHGPPSLICPKRGCMPSSSLERVEQAVIRVLARELAPLVLHVHTVSDSTESPLLCTIEHELSEMALRQSRLFDLLERGVYEESIFLQRQEVLSSQKEKLIETKARLFPKTLSSNSIEATDSINWETIYWKASPAARNQFLKTVVRHMEYKKDKGAAPSEFRLDIRLFSLA